MGTRRFVTSIVVATCATLGLASCQAGLGDQPEQMDSGIQGVPIPDTATEQAGIEGAWTVPEMSYEDLLVWYEEILPIGGEYQGLQYCETQEDDGVLSWLWWQEPESSAQEGEGTPWLSVRLFDEDPPGILITYDPTDPSIC